MANQSIHLTDFTHFLRGFKKKSKEFIINGESKQKDKEYQEEAAKFAYTFQLARSEIQLNHLIYIMKNVFESWKSVYSSIMNLYTWFVKEYGKTGRNAYYIGASMFLSSSNHIESYNKELRLRGFNEKKNKGKLLNHLIPTQLANDSDHFLQYPFTFFPTTPSSVCLDNANQIKVREKFRLVLNDGPKFHEYRAIDPKKYEPKNQSNYVLYYTEDFHISGITTEMIDNYEDGYYNDNFIHEKKDNYHGDHEYINLKSMSLDEYKEKYMKLQCVQWSSDLGSWWSDSKKFKHRGCCPGTYLMRHIDTQDSFCLIQTINKISNSVSPEFKKSKSSSSTIKTYNKPESASASAASASEGVQGFQGFQGPGIIYSCKRSHADMESGQSVKKTYKQYLGQEIARMVNSDIKKMDLRFGKVSQIRMQKKEPVFDITFVDGSISTLDLDQVNQAIALHHAFKNASNPE